MADETKIVGLKVGVDTGSGAVGLAKLEAAAGAAVSGLENLSKGTANAEKAINATGKAAAAASAHVHDMRGHADHAKYGMTELEMSLMNVQMRLMNLAMAAGLVSAPFAILAHESTQYLATIETAQLGIASAYMTSGDYIDETTGKVLKGSDALRAAQEDSIRMMEELQVANIQTTATLDQLVKAYQETLPVAMARGFNREQVKDYTVAMVQAASAIGLPFEQMGEETRSMLTGTINPRTSRIATVLGLRNEDLEPMKGNATELFSFLMEKLSAYRIAGDAAQHTWAGLWSNLKDIGLKAGGDTFRPLFDQIKYELEDITKHIVTIDDKTKRITWNQDFLDGINTVKGGITATIAEVYRFSMLLDKAGGTMTAIGAGMMKTAEVATRFMTLGQYGDSLRDGAAWMAKWNNEFESRYKDSDKALQTLANRGAGLDANGNPINKGSNSRYRPKPTVTDGDLYTETDTTDQLWNSYLTGLKGFNDQIRQLNPDLTEFQKKSMAIDESLERQLEKFKGYENNPGVQKYIESLKAGAAGAKQQLGIDYALKGNEMTPRQQYQFDQAAQTNKWEVAQAEYNKKEEQDQFNHNNIMAGLFNDMTVKKLQVEEKKTGDFQRSILEQYDFQQAQDMLNLQWTLDHTALTEEQAERVRAQYRAKRKAADEQLGRDLKTNEQNLQQSRLTFASQATNGLLDLSNSLVTLTGKKNKEMFMLQKAMASANAIVNTASGVTKALESYAPPYSYILAGITAAAGAAQIATIASTDIGSTSYTATTPLSMNGGGTMGSPVVTQPAGSSQQGSINITVKVEGNVIGEDRWVEERLAPAIRDLAKNRNVDFGLAVAA